MVAWFSRSRDDSSDEGGSTRRRQRQARALLEKAQGLAARGDLASAEEILGQVLELEPDNPRARLQRATLYLGRDETRAARAEIDHLFETGDAPLEAYQLGIIAALREPEIDRARRMLREGLERFEDAGVLFWLGCELGRRKYWSGVGQDQGDPLRLAHAVFERLFDASLVERALDFEETPETSLAEEIEADDPERAEGIRAVARSVDHLHEECPPDPRVAEVAFRDGHSGEFHRLVDADPLTWTCLECLEDDRIEFIPFRAIRVFEPGPVELAMRARLTMADATRREVRVPLLYRHSSRSRNAAVAGGGMTAWRTLGESLDLVVGLRLFRAEESEFGLETIGRLEFR